MSCDDVGVTIWPPSFDGEEAAVQRHLGISRAATPAATWRTRPRTAP